MTKYIDIGINLTNKQFQHDQHLVVQGALEAGVDQMILTGTSVRNSEHSLKLAKQYPGILFSTAGIHPHDAKNFNQQSIDQLRALLQQLQVVAVGECGLDFDRDFSPRPIQETCFDAQLQLAIEVQKPLFLHERAAFKRFFEIVKPYLGILPKAVVHCFTGSLDEAKQYLDHSFYLGFTGAISDMRRFAYLNDVIQYVPLERIMIETDAPFMLPKNIPKALLDPGHERRCEPKFLGYVAQTIAEIKGVSIAEVATKTNENSKHFFAI